MRKLQRIISFNKEEEKMNSKKYKKLSINSLPLIQKTLYKKNDIQISKKKNVKISKRSSVNSTNKIKIEPCKNINNKKKTITRKNSIKKDPSQLNEIFRKYSNLKSSIIIDSKGNNNLNQDQRNLIVNYFSTIKHQKIKIKINSPEKIKNKGENSKYERNFNKKEGSSIFQEESISLENEENKENYHDNESFLGSFLDDEYFCKEFITKKSIIY